MQESSWDWTITGSRSWSQQGRAGLKLGLYYGVSEDVPESSRDWTATGVSEDILSVLEKRTCRNLASTGLQLESARISSTVLEKKTSRNLASTGLLLVADRGVSKDVQDSS